MTGLRLFGIAAIFMFIFAARIGDELLVPISEEIVSTSKVQEEPSANAKSGDAGGLISKNLHTPQKVVPIDTAAFLSSFRRQSRDKLLPCLATWRAAPNSVLLSGRLYYGGELRNVQSLDEPAVLPGCVTEAILEMNFGSVAEILKENSWQSIQWQIDW
jgi:hypothetical protein